MMHFVVYRLNSSFFEEKQFMKESIPILFFFKYNTAMYFNPE